MFRVFVRKRKRRLWSPRTVALSVGVHLLLLGVVVARSSAAPAPEPEVVKDIWDIPDAPPSAPPGDPPAPVEPVEPVQPDEPDAPAPVPGETVELPAPATVPDGIPEVDPDAKPLTPDQVSGIGRVGTEPGTPSPPAPPPGNGNGAPPEPLPSFGDYVYEAVEEKPVLANAADVARLLDRHYPAALAASGVAGRVMLELTIEADGRVRPGSVRVVSATDDQFTAATLRIAERFRFRPARVEDRAVPVMVTLPIDWRPADR